MIKETKKTVCRKEKNQGMNWIAPKKRLAIYLRDGLACRYCGQGIEVGVKLTLDHLKPYSRGGSNQAGNLVTCCLTCNSARGNRPWRAFAGSVADYINGGRTAEVIIAGITAAVRRKLNVNEAAEIINRRGNFSSALQSLK